MSENKKPFKMSDGPMIMLLAFAAMLVGQVVFSLLILAVNGISELAGEILNLFAMIAFQGIYVAIFFVYTKKQNIKSDFWSGKITVWSVICAVVISAICFFSFSGLSQLFEVLLEKTGYTPSEIPTSGAFSVVLLAIATIFIAPIGEETIFRGALLSGAAKYGNDISLSLMSGALFALMHISPQQTVYQFFLGSVAAYAMLKSGNVLTSMIIHGLSNLFAVLLSYTDMGMKIMDFYVGQIGHNVIMTLIFCVLLPVVAVAAVWLLCMCLNKLEKKKYPEKFKRILFIDENTLTPVYELDKIGAMDEKSVFRQKELKKMYMEKDKCGFLGNKTYEKTLGIYIAVTVILWISKFVASL